CQHSFGTPYSF
nr:immunoglobulin light chain junction region [Macaca mulatta]MOX88722.1 immunoglobulin light chain junction region [Macaca mulatta]MOX90929.1 immunoglobulin light chain junction region [Macaca mulatta]